MAFVRKLQVQVEGARKRMSYVDRLRICVEENREEECEVMDYLKCMDIYREVAMRPHMYTREYREACEYALDRMLWEAIADQRKHRKLAEVALQGR